MKKENDYNYFIDFIKFIFSIIIVLYHTWMFSEGYGHGLFNYGYLAVGFYFIVTGYLMSQSLSKEKKVNEKIGIKTLKFLYKKIASIFPYILFSFIVGTLIIYKNETFSFEFLTKNYIVAELLQFGILGFRFAINSPTWYISAMLVSLAILYPLALKYKDNYNTLIAPLLLILVLGICYSFDIAIDSPLENDFIFLNGLYKGFIFTLLGNISYTITNWLKKINFKRTGKVLLTIIEFVLLICLICTMHFNFMGTIMFALMLLILVIIAFSGKSYSNKLFSLPFYKTLGKFGFIMYLNNLYFRTAINHSTLSFRYRNFIILYVGLTVALSLLAYYLVPTLHKLCKRIFLCLKRNIVS